MLDNNRALTAHPAVMRPNHCPVLADDAADIWFDAIDWVEMDSGWFEDRAPVGGDLRAVTQMAELRVPFTEDCRRCLHQMIVTFGARKQRQLLSLLLANILPGIATPVLLAADSLYQMMVERKNMEYALLQLLGLVAGTLADEINVIARVAGFIRTSVLNWRGSWLLKSLLGEVEDPTTADLFSALALAALLARYWLSDERVPQRRILRLPAFMAHLLLRAGLYWHAVGQMVGDRQPGPTALSIGEIARVVTRPREHDRRAVGPRRTVHCEAAGPPVSQQYPAGAIGQADGHCIRPGLSAAGRAGTDTLLPLVITAVAAGSVSRTPGSAKHQCVLMAAAMAGVTGLLAGGRMLWQGGCADPQKKTPQLRHAGLMKRMIPQALQLTLTADGNDYSLHEQGLSYEQAMNKTTMPAMLAELIGSTMDRNFYNRYFHQIIKKTISDICSENPSLTTMPVAAFLPRIGVYVHQILLTFHKLKVIQGIGLGRIQRYCIDILRFLNERQLTAGAMAQTLYRPCALSDTTAMEKQRRVAAILKPESLRRLLQESNQMLVAVSQRHLPWKNISREMMVFYQFSQEIFNDTSLLPGADVITRLIREDLTIQFYELYLRAGRVLSEAGFLKNRILLGDSFASAMLNAFYYKNIRQLMSVMVINAFIIPEMARIANGFQTTYLAESIINRLLFALEGLASNDLNPGSASPPHHPATPIAVTPKNIAADEVSVPTTSLRRYVDVALGIAGAGAAGAIAGGVWSSRQQAYLPHSGLNGLHPGQPAEGMPIDNTAFIGDAQPAGPSGQLFGYPSITNTLALREEVLSSFTPAQRRQYPIDQITDILRGKEMIIEPGLKIHGTEQANILEAKIMAKNHIDYVDECLTALLFKLDQMDRCTPDGVLFKQYLTGYFADLFALTDEAILTTVIRRFREVTIRTKQFSRRLRHNDYQNLWFVSSKANLAEGALFNEFSSLLSLDHLKEMPFAASYESEPKHSIIVVYAEKSHMTNLEHPDHFRRVMTHHLGETLLHEFTHASAATDDYMYFTRTFSGRARCAGDMIKEFDRNSRLGIISDALRAVIEGYCRAYNKLLPTDIADFLATEPLFKTYLIMNNAASYEVFFRDIARGVGFNHPPPF